MFKKLMGLVLVAFIQVGAEYGKYKRAKENKIFTPKEEFQLSLIRISVILYVGVLASLD